MRIGVLWQARDLGLYSNASFESLYKGIGRNNGNLAFVYAIMNSIQGDIKVFPWHSSGDTLRRECDILVIPCANQLGGHTDLGGMAQRLRAAEKPIVAIGLGAQSKSTSVAVEVSPGTLDWVRAINDSRYGSGPNIYTRGPYSSTQLDRLGIPDSTVGGCPSHFINSSPDLGNQINSNWNAVSYPRAIAVAAGHPSWRQYIDIEHQLVGLMTDDVHPGEYIVQSMEDMIKLSRGSFDRIEEESLEKIRDYIAPHLSRADFISWCGRYCKSYYDIPSWMDTLRRHDLVIGTRYHGVALAIQAGRMGCTITTDSRTEELCQQTGVPCLPASALKGPITRRTLRRELIKFDPHAYDKLRKERAACYRGFLIDNGLAPSAALSRLAESPDLT